MVSLTDSSYQLYSIDNCVLLGTVKTGRDEAASESLHTSVEEADETGRSQ